MLKRLLTITTLFSIYIFPASARANINSIELDYETVGFPIEETKKISKNNISDLIAQKSPKSDPKKKGNGFLKFLGLLVLSYALIEILEMDSSSKGSGSGELSEGIIILLSAFCRVVEA